MSKGEAGARGSRRVRASLAVALSLAVVAATGCLAGGPLTGKPAPAFEIATSDGALVNGSTYLGKFVILDLMATWCGPCKLEVAHLRDAQAALGDKAIILSIDADPTETSKDLDAFEAKYGSHWPYGIDRSGNLSHAFQMRIIPKLVILDPQGVVIFEREGEVLPAAIVRAIDPSAAPAQPLAPVLTGAAGVGVGFLAALSPYRRHHRDGEGGGPTLAALGIVAVISILAWPFAGLASTRATYGSLAIGAMALAAAAWWWIRAREAAPAQPRPGAPWQRALDRGYELGAGAAAALVLALGGIGVASFFAPIIGFLGGALAAYTLRARLSQRAGDALGLLGLLLSGIGLMGYGLRILLA